MVCAEEGLAKRSGRGGRAALAHIHRARGAKTALAARARARDEARAAPREYDNSSLFTTSLGVLSYLCVFFVTGLMVVVVVVVG